MWPISLRTTFSQSGIPIWRYLAFVFQEKWILKGVRWRGATELPADFMKSRRQGYLHRPYEMATLAVP